MGTSTQKMKVAAYCRVSTDKEDQLASLEAQKNFFEEYAQLHHYELYGVYADEGISGTKLKKRLAFHQMMADARLGKFSKVFVKDISRFARNAVDFLTSIRELKAMGIPCEFVNSNLSTEDGEFTLGILALVAQEESANMSKRVKFGKSKNAKKGKVPNLVYGYNKTKGDLFHLEVNAVETENVKRIYRLYTEEGYGALKIAQLLNREGLKTKRGCQWSQNAVSRILTNPIYIGRIINGKEEIEDFLTGIRRKTPTENWYISENPELAVIAPKQFQKAQKILASRRTTYQTEKKKSTGQYPFSTLIKCEECGHNFRRIHKTLKSGDYTKWGCSNRNTNGKTACANGTLIDEQQLLEEIIHYISNQIKDKELLKQDIFKELEKQSVQTNGRNRKELERELQKTLKLKEKQLKMYEADAITIEELKERTADLNNAVEQLNLLLNQSKNSLVHRFHEQFENSDSFFTPEQFSHYLLSQLIDKISVGSDGKISVFFKE